jgi:hypothetical protein
MAIKLASLFIELAVNGSRLTAELRNSETRTRAWARATEQSAAAAKKAFAAVGTAVVANTAVLAAMYVTNAQALDSLAKTASKLGDDAANLKTYGLAAEYSGVSSDALNISLQRMTRRLSEAAKGGGEAKDAIAELGLDAQELARKPPTEAFEEIQRALEGVESQSDRVRLAFKFYDSEGVALVNVLGATIDKAKDDVEAFGGALTSLELSRIEAANDSVARVGLGFDLLTDKLTAKMAPAVQVVADQLFASASQGDQLERVLDQLVKSTLIGFASAANVAGATLRFIDGRSEIATYGVIGYMLWGKKGLLLGASLGVISDVLKDTFDSVATQFSGTATQIDKVNAEIDRLETKLKLLEAPGMGFLSTDEGLDDLRARIDGLKDQAAVLGGPVVSSLDETQSLALAAADGFELLSATLDETIAKYGQLDSAAITLVAPGVIDTSTVGSTSSVAANDSPVAAEEETYRESLRRQADMYLEFLDGNRRAGLEAAQLEAAANQEVYESYFAQRLFDAEMFESTWTLFQRSGASDRLAILGRETSSALNTLSTHSRAFFNINRAVGLANATVSIATGISKALELPFPANLAAAATVALQGAAQIVTIKNAKFGQASVAQPGGGASTDVSSPASGLSSQTTGQPAPAQQSTAINVIVIDRGFDDDERMTDTVMDILDTKISSRELTGRVDRGDVRLQINRERARGTRAA